MFLALFNWFVKITGWLPAFILLRSKVHYEDKSIQSRRIKGRAIIASNHNMTMDFAVMMFFFYSRTLRCVAAEILYERNFFLKIFLKMMGTIRADRTDHNFGFLEKAASVLSKGGVVEIYPEARLPKENEEAPIPFKPSTVYLALQTDTPIIPVYTKRRKLSFKRSDIVIGKPINLRDLYDDSLSEKQNIEILTETLRGKIIELKKQLEQSKTEKEKEEVRQ